MQRGLLCYPIGGTIEGRHGTHMLLARPFIATETELDELVAGLDPAPAKALAIA